MADWVRDFDSCIRFNVNTDRQMSRDITLCIINVLTCNIFFAGIVIDFQDEDDKVSICYRPSEHKFFDLLDMIRFLITNNWPITIIDTLLNSADIKTKGKKGALTIQRKKLDRVSSFMQSVGGCLGPDVIVQEDDMLKMTAEKIAKKLCGNKDCPAVQKFKEYGTDNYSDWKG